MPSARGPRQRYGIELSTHRGGISGTGSHRSSIFRLHVGAALALRDLSWAVASWGSGQVAAAGVQASELSLERKVSEYLGSMRVLWIDVADEPSPFSDRAFIERNSIGLLSRHGVLARDWGLDWLGTDSEELDIATSGLWNLNHLYSTPHNDFIPVLTSYISATLGKTSPPTQSIAPPSWYSRKEVIDSNQLALTFDDSSKAPGDP